MTSRLFNSLPRGPMTVATGLALVLALFGSVAARRGPEACPGGRALGDKWFDGCHWCVCTGSGRQCSSSGCSSLVERVPACHTVGQKWTDGCYRCRCKRHGIACRLDPACLLLTINPVPCLADDRCVCGPDGVPSCTAEVIDRHAFAARRVDLDIPALISQEDMLHWRRGEEEEGRWPSRHHHRSGRRSEAAREEEEGRGSAHQRHGDGSEAVREEENRWSGHHHRSSGGRSAAATEDTRPSSHHRGGAEGISTELRSQTDTDKILEEAAMLLMNDQPDLVDPPSSQELLITSDNLCRFGPRWYGGSLRCFCDIDGAITCGNPAFVSAFFDDFRVEQQECEEGHAWEQGCSVCSCRVNGIIFCRHNRNCRRLQHLSEDEEDDNGIDHYLPVFPQVPAIEEEVLRETGQARTPSLHHRHREGCVPGTRWKDGCLHCHCTRHGRPSCSRSHCQEEEVEDPASGDVETNELVPSPVRNDALHVPATVNPDLNRNPRGPMMRPPILGAPSSVYRPPAYSRQPDRQQPTRPGCGRFRVGQKFWDDCNLCLCTSRGPKCQGKLCG